MKGNLWKTRTDRFFVQRMYSGKNLLFLAVIFALLLAACSNGTGTQKNQSGPVTLRVVGSPKGPNPDLFNPYFSTNQGSSYGTQGLLYEPLYIVNNYNAKYTPWLATSYKYNADVTELTFELRQGVKWSDGQPFTSADVAFTVNLMKSYPALDTQALWASRLKSVATSGDYTVVFTLQHPDSTLLYRLGANVFIVPEHKWKDIQGDPAKFANDDNPVGTGPFKLVSHSDALIKYTRNPSFWGKKPEIEQIEVPQSADNGTAALQISTGEIDWTGVGWDTNLDANFAKKDAHHNQHWFAPSNTVMLYMNLQKAPFNLLPVRQAVSLAIDREELMKKGAVFAAPANPSGVLLPNFTDYVDPKYASAKFSVDLAKAESLLQGAGFTKDANGYYADKSGKELSISLLDVNGWNDWVADSQLIQNDLEKIGIKTVINTVGGYTPYINALQGGNYDAAISWTDGGPSPYYPFFDLLSSTYSAPAGKPTTGGTNFERWSDPATDKLLAQYSQSADPEVQKQALYGLQKIMVEQLPAIPLSYNPYWYEYTTNHLQGWPDEKNPYAVGAPYQQPDLEMVVLNLKPIS